MFAIEGVIPESCSSLLNFCHGLLVSKRVRILWKVAASAILCALWLERNKRIFGVKR